MAVVGYIAWKFFSRPKSAPPKSHNEVHASVFSDTSNEDQDKDAWEGWFFDEATDPKPVDARLKITYLDGESRRTERVINVLEFDNAITNSKSGLIIAKCELRAARRTFRFDRIQSAVDMETGELIKDVQDYLRQIWTESPKRSLMEFEDQFYGPLQALLFIARADGRLVAKERAVILEFCRKHLSDQRITDDELNKSIKAVTTLSLQSFKLLVGRLLQENQQLADDLIVAAEAIVAAEKTVHPSELEALEYLKRRYSEIKSLTS